MATWRSASPVDRLEEVGQPLNVVDPDAARPDAVAGIRELDRDPAALGLVVVDHHHPATTTARPRAP